MFNRCFLLLCFLIFSTNFSFALSDEDINGIYEPLTEGYFRGIQMSIANVPVSQQAKDNFMQKFRQNFDKQDFINKTYPCFQQDTEAQLSTDHKIIQGCVSDYLVEYSQNQQHLFVELVMPQSTF